MITITVYGLDDYTIGHYSKDHTKNIANLFETSEDNISFAVPNLLMFHKGVDQNSWNTLIYVHAPTSYKPFEENVAKYIGNSLQQFSINVAIEFYYYEKENRHEFTNKEYPSFISESNLVNIENEELNDDEELCVENVFAGFEEKLKAKQEEATKAEEHHCECGGHCCHDKDHHKH